MIINRVYIRDVRNWEEEHNKNILGLFDGINIRNLAALIQIFTHLDEEEIFDLLDAYLENSSLIEIYEQIRDAFIGYRMAEDIKTDASDDSENIVDLRQYEFMYKYYEKVCMQLMSLGLTYSEFWGLTTREIYSVYEAIQHKMVLDMNSQLQLAYNSAILIGGAVWGKIPKEAPKIELDAVKSDDTIINTKYGEMTYRDYKSLLALEKLGGGEDE